MTSMLIYALSINMLFFALSMLSFTLSISLLFFALSISVLFFAHSITFKEISFQTVCHKNGHEVARTIGYVVIQLLLLEY